MKVNDERCYVLLSIKWCTEGTLVFWGRRTLDDKERSFGGYTNDINACERYTFDEARNERHTHHKYNEGTLEELMNIERSGTWIVHIDDLDKLGRRSTVFNY